MDCPFEINGVLTPTTGWLDDVSTAFAIEYMKQNRDRPFAMAVGFKSPHSPRGGKNLPERLKKLYSNEVSRTTPSMGIPAIYHKPDPKTGKYGQGFAENAAHLDYFRHMAGVDENLGKLLSALDALAISEDTVIVYTSDNGYFFGEHCLGDKRAIYEEALRVPMLVRYPRLFGKGKVVDELVLNIDLAPTLLDLAGVPVHSEMQGVSWKGLAAGQKPANWRTSFLAEYYKEMGDTPTLVGIRTATEKLIKYKGHDEWTEVFDVVLDPCEMKNKVSDPAVTARLATELEAQMKAMKYTESPQRAKP
jgi:arylsulfatase A-like enzyme